MTREEITRCAKKTMLNHISMQYEEYTKKNLSTNR